MSTTARTWPPAPPINVNPLNRVAVAAASVSRLPECAARMPHLSGPEALLITAASTLQSLGWQNRNPLAKR